MKSRHSSKAAPRLGPNLWEPREEDRDMGAHGSFDEKWRACDPVPWAAPDRRDLVGGIVGGVLAGAAAGAAITLAGGRD